VSAASSSAPFIRATSAGGALDKDGEKKGVFRAFASVELKGLLGMYFYSYLWLDPKGVRAPKGIAQHLKTLALKRLMA